MTREPNFPGSIAFQKSEWMAARRRPCGAVIRGIRQKKGFNILQLAEKCHVNKTYIGHIELGMTTSSEDFLVRLGKELRVDSDALCIMSGFLPFHLLRHIADNTELYQMIIESYKKSMGRDENGEE